MYPRLNDAILVSMTSKNLRIPLPQSHSRAAVSLYLFADSVC